MATIAASPVQVKQPSPKAI